MNNIIGFFDGSLKNNKKGIAAYWKGIQTFGYNYFCSGFGNNSNHAEFESLIMLLNVFIDHGYKSVTIYGDSKTVIDQINGEIESYSDDLLEYYAKAKSLLNYFDHVNIQWIPRSDNFLADRLSKMALKSVKDIETNTFSFEIEKKSNSTYLICDLNTKLHMVDTEFNTCTCPTSHFRGKICQHLLRVHYDLGYL